MVDVATIVCLLHLKDIARPSSYIYIYIYISPKVNFMSCTHSAKFEFE